MLTEFTLSLEDLKGAQHEMQREISRCPSVSEKCKRRIIDLTDDVVGFGQQFARAHVAASMWVIDSNYEATVEHQLTEEWNGLLAKGEADGITHAKMLTAIRSRSQRRFTSIVNTREQEAQRDLKTAYKAYLFFLRALQDGCWAVCLELHGEKSGYSSITKAFKGDGAPHKIVRSVPEFEAWFAYLRDFRNSIKVGAGLALVGPVAELGVQILKWHNGMLVFPGGQSFRFRDVIVAMHLSIALQKAIAVHAKGLADAIGAPGPPA